MARRTPTTDRWDTQWWFPEAPGTERPKWFLVSWVVLVFTVSLAGLGIAVWLLR